MNASAKLYLKHICDFNHDNKFCLYSQRITRDTEHTAAVRLFLCAQWADGMRFWMLSGSKGMFFEPDCLFFPSLSPPHNRWVSPQPCSIIMEGGGCWVTVLSQEKRRFVRGCAAVVSLSLFLSRFLFFYQCLYTFLYKHYTCSYDLIWMRDYLCELKNTKKTWLKIIIKCQKVWQI